MKVISFFLLSLLLVDTACSEQRLASIHPGVPCSKISEIEKSLGSLELVVQKSDEVRKYKGTEGGKTATIVYLCDEGMLSEQTIIITSNNRDEADSFAKEQVMELTKRLGSPIHNGLDLGIWQRMLFSFLGADLDYLGAVVVWGKEKEDVMLLIREIETNRWEISISQGSSKFEYILNS